MLLKISQIQFVIWLGLDHTPAIIFSILSWNARDRIHATQLLSLQICCHDSGLLFFIMQRIITNRRKYYLIIIWRLYALVFTHISIVHISLISAIYELTSLSDRNPLTCLAEASANNNILILAIFCNMKSWIVHQNPVHFKLLVINLNALFPFVFEIICV